MRQKEKIMTSLDEPRGRADTAPTRRPAAKRWLPLAAVLLAIAASFALGLNDYLSFETLRQNRMALADFVDRNAVLAVLSFIGIYALSTALSLPGAAALTVAGGFLFGSVVGSLWVVIAATLGATGIFLAARSAFGGLLQERAGPFLRKMEAGFRENALSYLLFLRLVPVFPFFVVNLVPAFLGVSLRDYVIATFIGIIPGSFVYASVGAGLGSYFDANAEASLAGVLTPEVIIALAGLSLLSLAPIAYKRWNRKRVGA
jgi:uncharacterized membrane protein YdjX (TVP38/TMEM64 family)